MCFLGAKSQSYSFNGIYNNMTYDLSTKEINIILKYFLGKFGNSGESITVVPVAR